MHNLSHSNSCLKLPNDYVPFIDKYFSYSNIILKAEGINPIVGMNIFARGTGNVHGLDEAVAILNKFSSIKHNKGKVWVTKKKAFQTKDTLMLIEAPIQSYIELETMYLGVLSNAISLNSGFAKPDFTAIKNKFARLKQIYQDIPIIYFGARHYHWSLDHLIAKAALEGGAIQTSTDIGSSNIGLQGAGTMPHLLILILAEKYGIEKATLMAAKLFDKYIDKNVPRTVLIDTFNRELTDTALVAEFFGKRDFSIRVDTCGENIGEGVKNYQNNANVDPNFQMGRGVVIDLILYLKNKLTDLGCVNNSKIFLSSGFGNEKKAKTFMSAWQEYKDKTGYNLFDGVGIGEATPGIFCTADVFMVNGQKMYKTGRDINIDYNSLEIAIE